MMDERAKSEDSAKSIQQSSMKPPRNWISGCCARRTGVSRRSGAGSLASATAFQQRGDVAVTVLPSDVKRIVEDLMSPFASGVAAEEHGYNRQVSTRGRRHQWGEHGVRCTLNVCPMV